MIIEIIMLLLLPMLVIKHFSGKEEFAVQSSWKLKSLNFVLVHWTVKSKKRNDHECRCPSKDRGAAEAGVHKMELLQPFQ